MTLPLALTMGEPAGIGGEIALKAWLARSGNNVPPVSLIDDPGRLSRLAATLGWDVKIVEIDKRESAVSLFGDALPVVPLGASPRAAPGRPDPADANLVIAAIDVAVAG